MLVKFLMESYLWHKLFVIHKYVYTKKKHPQENYIYTTDMQITITNLYRTLI